MIPSPLHPPATARLLRPRPQTISLSRAALGPPPLPRRPFLTLPASAPQVLTARRTLPYHHARLFDLIADIDSYAGFLPYCKASRVTAWTTTTTSPSDQHEDEDEDEDEDPQQQQQQQQQGEGSRSRRRSRRRWPARADLTAGWGALEETYTSRVFCVPAGYDGSSPSPSPSPSPSCSIVEAISGDARTEIPASVLDRYGLRDEPAPPPRHGSNGGAVFRSLVTRWTVSPAEEKAAADGWSDVRLSIKFQFANPLYGALSSAVADKVAPVMVEAFVARARRVLGEPRSGP